MQRILAAVFFLAATAGAADSSDRYRIIESQEEFEEVKWKRQYAFTCEYGDCPLYEQPAPRLHAYYGVKGKKQVMPFRVQLQYEGSDWIYVERLIFKTDAGLVEQRVKRNEQLLSGGIVSETADFVPEPRVKAALCSANSLKVRMDGSQGIKDFEISPDDLRALKEMCTRYAVERR
jgi:hypothetical protein